MKKVFVLIIALTACSVVHAQKVVTWGVKAGMNISNIAEKYTGVVSEGKSKSDYVQGYNARVGFNFGVTADVRLCKSFYIQPALLYTRLGADIATTVSAFDGTTGALTETSAVDRKINMSYLQLPVLFSYKMTLSKRTKWEINAGPYVSVGIGGKMRGSNTVNGEKYDYPKMDVFGYADVDVDDETGIPAEGGKGGVQRFDVGLSFGTGFTFNKIYVGINYDLGLSNIAHNKLTGKGGALEHYKAKNRNFALSVGYRF